MAEMDALGREGEVARDLETQDALELALRHGGQHDALGEDALVRDLDDDGRASRIGRDPRHGGANLVGGERGAVDLPERALPAAQQPIALARLDHDRVAVAQVEVAARHRHKSRPARQATSRARARPSQRRASSVVSAAIVMPRA